MNPRFKPAKMGRGAEALFSPPKPIDADGFGQAVGTAVGNALREVLDRALDGKKLVITVEVRNK